ncbi:MAG: acetyl/propionyl/methylcrotonyl-CoA carboxylase subunit alpha [Proteobacteria bacterium]|nr:acetyl/propionyl/methylcrotonyl-CoA carboxylase subunit alpha [Pseudomonadota bacterium]
MFRKILIANRGEIACRVMRTANRLGAATVAVYSEADAGAMHVAMADEAVLIGPSPAQESYLLIEKIIAAAQRTGAGAIHPGYGFLAENAAFAEACAAAFITFIGPPAAAIRAMGEKAAAKSLMVKANVPVVPGYHGDDQDDAVLFQAAAEIGYPVLIKAVSGGGGKGMRQVNEPGGFANALKGARREGLSSFGDDKVLVEKYLERPRHIEIQIFADQQGNIVHLFERDCSIQRRHQKVIEEAPAPGMTPEMRRSMGDAAVAAARAIGYVGAGTVEFIADVSHGLSEDRFYFMEMNTRLQVEHPVTEMITGQDLVEWQLRVAAGEPLPMNQDNLVIDGHAVEARIYSENPQKNFLPATGTLHRLRPPKEGPHLRVDTGVREGDEVTMFYDPMIAKLVVWDRDRASALRRLLDGLERYEIAGVMTNVNFLAAVAAHPAFAAGDLETGFIDKYKGDLIPTPGPIPDQALALACLDLLLARKGHAAAADPHSPWARVDGWRLNDEGHDELSFRDDGDGDDITVTVHYPGAGGYRLALPGGDMLVNGEVDEGGTLWADLDGLRVSAAVVHDSDKVTILSGGRAHRIARIDPMALRDYDLEEGGKVTAPLPGKIVQVHVEAGAVVKKGDPLLILEAMKMEHTIAAPRDAVIAAIPFAPGEQVDEGTELILFEASKDG